MNNKKITLLTSLGAALEYYDFVIYALMANFISKHFFPTFDSYAALIATFGIFAVGYIMRPIGGVLFGILGDRFGRKPTFLFTLMLMACSTFCMGIVPTYVTWGLSASLIFMLLRMIQGISYGAELPGSLIFLIEHVNHESRGRNCGFMISSLAVGVTTAYFVAYIISHVLTNEQMASWGWRLSFLFGGVLALVGYFIRKKTVETPLFIKLENKNHQVIKNIATNYWKNLLQGLGLMMFPSAFVIFGLSMPSYLHDSFGYRLTDVYLVQTISHIYSMILIFFIGGLSDYIGRKRLLLITLIATALIMFPLFKILLQQNIFGLSIFIFVYQTIIAFMAGCYFAMLAENFPTAVRYTGVAFCYNIAYVFAAFVPMIIAYMGKIAIKAEYVSLVFIILVTITILAVLTIRDQTRVELQ